MSVVFCQWFGMALNPNSNTTNQVDGGIISDPVAKPLTINNGHLAYRVNGKTKVNPQKENPQKIPQNQII